MKRFVATLNDGSYINIPATRIERIQEECAITAWDENELVAYVDVSAVISAHIGERKDVYEQKGLA